MPTQLLRPAAAALFLATLLAACGGGDDEPRATIYTSLPHGDDYFVKPGSAGQIQAELRQRGIVFSNPRCADWQRDPRPGRGRGWVEGIHPVYLVLDVPESSLAQLNNAQLPHRFGRDPEQNPEIVLPYFDCATRGY